MHACVTGASGFIGQRLCRKLKEIGATVTAVTRSGDIDFVDHVIRCDLVDVNLPVDMLCGIDVVFHLAGQAHAVDELQQDEKEYTRNNTDGTRNILELSQHAGVKRFVFFSTVKVMNEGSDSCVDEASPCQPETAYGRSKFAAERLVMEGGYVLEPVSLRLTMVYGPTRIGNLPRMILAVSRGKFPPIPDVQNMRSMVHVDDVVDAALLCAMKLEAAGQIFIITDGTIYSTRQIYLAICDSLGKKPHNWVVPILVFQFAARAGDIIGRLRGRRFIIDSSSLDKLLGSACYSSEKIQKEIGFIPQMNLTAALPQIINYLGLTKCP